MGHYCCISVSAGESAVPEFHGSPLLLPAASHLFLSGTSLSHDAAGETPAVFRLEVWTRVYKTQSCVAHNKKEPIQTEVYNDLVPWATWHVVSPLLLMNSRQPRKPVRVHTELALCCAASSLAQKQFPDSN